jgi:hypothetical protein
MDGPVVPTSTFVRKPANSRRAAFCTLRLNTNREPSPDSVRLRPTGMGSARPVASPEFAGDGAPKRDISAMKRGAYGNIPRPAKLFDYGMPAADGGRRRRGATSSQKPIRRVLADTFIFGFGRRKRTPVPNCRDPGLRAVRPASSRGEPFLGLWAADSRGLVGALIRVVAQESVGMVVGVSGVSKAGRCTRPGTARAATSLIAAATMHACSARFRLSRCPLGRCEPPRRTRDRNAALCRPRGETRRCAKQAVAARGRTRPARLVVYDGGGSPRSQSGSRAVKHWLPNLPVGSQVVQQSVGSMSLPQKSL